jgi:hypothetical protein
MPEQRSTLRAGALIAASALALHELRYLIGYGDASGQALASQGHSYLPAAGALVALALALAAAQLVTALAHVLRGDRSERRPAPLWLAWSLGTLALLGVYTGQELTEGLLASGHPAGFDAVVADGGLVAVPRAIGVGLLVALVMRGAHAAIAAVARRGRTALPSPARALRAVRLVAAPVRGPSSSVIARNLAGRAPPVAS